MRRTALAVAILALAPALAAAAPRVLSLDHDFVILPPPRRPLPPRLPGDGPQVVYLNCNGGTISNDDENAMANASLIPDSPVTIPPFAEDPGVGVLREDLIDELRGRTAALFKFASEDCTTGGFNVRFVTERPHGAQCARAGTLADGTTGPVAISPPPCPTDQCTVQLTAGSHDRYCQGSDVYTMVMVGGTQSLLGLPQGVVGIAPLDCGNETPNNVVFAFSAALQDDVETTAQVIAHELGHSFGLSHVDNPESIMYPSASPPPVDWEAGPLVEPSPCHSATREDPRQLLEQNLGFGEGDCGAPRVWFLSPGPGARLPIQFNIEAGARDAETFVEGLRVSVFDSGASEPRFTIDIPNPPYRTGPGRIREAGRYRLQLEGRDPFGNTASAEMEVDVDPYCATDGGTCTYGRAGIGAACTAGADCASGLCLRNASPPPDTRAVFCSEDCSADGLCPQGTRCRPASPGSSTRYCTPAVGSFENAEGESGGGGCAVAGRAPQGALLAALAALGFALAARRRR